MATSKSSATPDCETAEARRVGLRLLLRQETYAKVLTTVYLVAWLSTLAYAETVTLLGYGDAGSISYIVDNVTELGKIVFGFYFGTKVLENCCQGWEAHLEKMAEAPADDSDGDARPVE